LLTLGAALDIAVYEMGQARPVVVFLECDSGGLLAGMSGGRDVMVSAKDFSSKLQIIWNVNSSKVEKEETLVD
jgi:hypothetical protein